MVLHLRAMSGVAAMSPSLMSAKRQARQVNADRRRTEAIMRKAQEAADSVRRAMQAVGQYDAPRVH